MTVSKRNGTSSRFVFFVLMLSAVGGGNPCKIMNITKVPHRFPPTSRCFFGNITIEGDCVEDWLEDKTLAGFRVWQLAGIIISLLITITVGLCCCIRFRIPRTKQEIEADWIRKKLTKRFRHELNKINNKEINEMDLKTALEKVRSGFDNQTILEHQPKRDTSRISQGGIRWRFNRLLRRVQVPFIPSSSESNVMI